MDEVRTMAAPRQVRALVRVTTVAWAGVAGAAVLWTWIAGGAFLERLGLTALSAGAVLMLTSGNILSRSNTLASSGWGIAVNRHRDEDVREAGGVSVLTGLGFSLLIGGPLLVVGALLLL
jgi:hypothetical protein